METASTHQSLAELPLRKLTLPTFVFRRHGTSWNRYCSKERNRFYWAKLLPITVNV
jgi:hypothetical protein